jgi:hypothetical protein
MRIFEKHRNGAILDVDGEPERAAQILVEWRQYQDKSTPPARPVGFVKSEEERHE